MRSTICLRGCLAATSALVLLGGLTSPAAAQPPDVTISEIAETDVVHSGTTARVALEVALDPGFHVNSNTPLDEFLIPTVLTLDPPAGISLEALAFPEAILLEQLGAEQPLAVFEEKFLIGAALTLDRALSPGSYAVPGTLRYQACNDRMCFNPTNVSIQFDLTVASATQ
ncbi:MAG: protein-disulfide reductase DsbD domain-containing protein, partial [Vicinamibacterales bacterium]